MLAADICELIESESSAVKLLKTRGLLSDDIVSSSCTECDGVKLNKYVKKRLAIGEVREYTAARCV